MRKNRRKQLKVVVGIIMLMLVAYGGWRVFSHVRHTHEFRFVESSGRTDAGIVKKEYRFDDLNDTHLEAAKRKGIKPVANREHLDKRKLKKIESCSLYKVDDLTHSVPYLTPGAEKLLFDIGTRFQETLKEQGLREHHITVTSVLRTGEDIKQLQRSNVNASANSAHQYATTFDITYVRFDCRSFFGHSADNEQLANTLGDVLNQLRAEGRCYIKYERKQRCFHITSRE